MQPSRLEALLENGISEAADGIAGLFAQVRTVDPKRDESGHARSRAYGDVVALMKASARVGQTIAQLRGSKFEHTFNVRRQEMSASSRNDEDDDAEYDTNWRWLDNKETLYNWKSKQRYKLEKPNTDASATPASPQLISESSIGNAAEGDPPPISEGSNGNFGAASSGTPAIGRV